MSPQTRTAAEVSLTGSGPHEEPGPNQCIGIALIGGQLPHPRPKPIDPAGCRAPQRKLGASGVTQRDDGLLPNRVWRLGQCPRCRVEARGKLDAS